MPVALNIARETRTSPSKWLLPISYASMCGGVCTLIGTSTNILVSNSAVQHGQPAFSMFEFSRLGLVMLAAGTAYMFFIGRHLIPPRRDPGDLTQTFGLGDYLTEIVLLPHAKSVGKSLREAPLLKNLEIAILEVRRGDQPVLLPAADTILQAGDQLLVRCSVEKIRALQERSGIELRPAAQWRDADLQSSDLVLVEAVIAPGADLHGKSIKAARFRNEFDAVVLALRHHGRLLYENLADTILQAGDALLVEIRRKDLDRLRRSNEFVLVSEVGLPEFHRNRLIPALAIMTGVIAAAALDVFPIVVSAILGCVLMILTGCLTLTEAYEAIEWRVIVLLGGVMTLGIAMDNTGAAQLIAAWITDTIGAWGPVALLAAFYGFAMFLSALMSNNATALVVAPIAVAAAESLGADPRPFLVAVAFAASADFMTPIGYQTNLLVYGPGQYRFSDYLRVGAPLNLLFWVLATWLIPRWWPL
jgi:di/tricarboxylate transporter